LPHLQSPDPGKGPRSYSLASLKRTFELSQKRTYELGCYINVAYNKPYVELKR
jgi:hypothetical protein